MADLGMSNAPVNRFAGSANRASGRNATTRHKLQTALHIGLFSAAFIFVAAVVFGVLV